MLPITDPSKQIYYPREDNDDFNLPSLDGPFLTEIAIQNMFSVDTNNSSIDPSQSDSHEKQPASSLKRSFSQNSSTHPSKRKKTTVEAKGTANQEKDNTVLQQSIDTTTIPTHLLFHTEQTTNNAVTRMTDEIKSIQIKNNYVVPPSHVGYYQNVFERESKELFEAALQLDLFEAQAVLGGTQGVTQWIRKGFYNGHEIYKGLIYANGRCSLYLLPTDQKLVSFFNQNASIPNLEALRKGKIGKIQSECSVYFSSIRYYQDVFRIESEGSPEKAHRIDVLEAQAVLDSTQKKTWWIRKGFHNDQETYKGIIYENGACSHHILLTGNDLIYFFNKNSSIPHLEILRKEKIDKIQKGYVVQFASKGYYRNVFIEECTGSTEKAHRIDFSEAQAVLGDTQGKTWWIRKSFHNGQETYKGIAYENGVCFHHVLPTGNDLIYFFNKNSSNPHIEVLRKERVSKIQSEWSAYFSSIRYYEDIFRIESEGSSKMAYQMDSSEAQAILGTTQGKTWWIRKNLHNGQKAYKGIVYENGKCSHYILLTNNDLIYFFGKNSSIPHLEALRQEKIEKVNKIRSKYMIRPSSEEYYQTIFDEEYQEIAQKALEMDFLEAQTVLESVNGTTWWIRDGSYDGQKVHKGVVYVNGACSYCLLCTDQDLLSFYNKNSSNPHLEALRKEKVEKINKIRNKYMIQPSSKEYYQTIFHEEHQEIPQKALQVDCLEAQTVLDQTQGQTWWIRDGSYNGQKIHKGVVYVDGACSYCLLCTDQDLLSFCNQNSSIPHLEALRQEKIERANKIRSKYMIQPSSEEYYQTIFLEEYQEISQKSLPVDCLEAHSVLESVNGTTWWIRKGFYNDQGVHKGVVYVDGTCSYCLLHTDQDLLSFYSQNSSIPHLEALRQEKIEKIDKIRSKYMIQPSSEEYYQTIFHEEHQETPQKSLQVDCLEAQTVLDQIQGKTWWIRDGSYNDQKVHKGVIYVDGTCSYCLLHTDQDLLSFCNQNSSIPHLEALRQEKIEKINKIRNKYMIQPSSEKYYQTIFHEEHQETPQKSLQVDCLEAQTVLDQIQGKTWWIRDGSYNDQKVHKGVVYVDGTCSYCLLRTDQDLLSFCNQNSSIPHLEALRQEKIEKSNQIRSKYMIQPSSKEYYQTIFLEEHKGTSQKVLQLDCLEAQIVLSNTQGKTWWVRDGFYNGQKAHKGVVYVDGMCSYYPLRRDQDLLSLCDQNSSIPHLETLRQERINTIQNTCTAYFSSIKYYQDVLSKELESQFVASHRMDCLEAQTILGDSQGQTWWIRKGFYKNQEIYKGILYLNGKCSYSALFTGNDLIVFSNKNSPIPNLEKLRQEKIEKINQIRNKHMIQPSSKEYYQIIFHEECREIPQKVLQLDCLEAQIVLGNTQGKTWWIRDGSYNDQKVHKGVVYVDGTCSYCLLCTDQDLLSFCDQNSSVPHLEALRQEKINTTQNACTTYFSSIKYYQDVLSKELESQFITAHQMDCLEAQAVLGSSQGQTWWIRNGFYEGQKTYKGVLYLNGECSYSALFTGNDLIVFSNKNSSIPNLETLRQEKIKKINILQSNYNNHMFSCSSSAYCQSVFNEECRNSLENAYHMDVLEAQTVLESVNGTTWWIREGFYNNQRISKGIVYVDGMCSYHLLLTKNDWIAFFDKNFSILDLKTLQKKRREKVNMIQNNHMFFISSSAYCQSVFNEECRNSLENAYHMDVLEAQTALGSINGTTWWAREGFYNNQRISKGIVYVDGMCSYHLLLTENDRIAFFDKNTSTLDLKMLQKKRREKINMIQNNHMFFTSSSAYCQTVYNEEYKGSFETAHKMDVLEAKTVLGVMKKTWWIREGFFDNQRISKGIVYVDGMCSYHLLLTENDWIAFFDENSSIPDLKAFQREQVEKINPTRRNFIFFCSSSAYCQSVFNEECKDSLEKAYHMDVLEAQTGLGSIDGTTWWIREGFYNNQKICKGIVYTDGICSCHLLLTENDWIVFFDKNASTSDLKTIQKMKREKINTIQSNHTFFCSSNTYCQTVYTEEYKGSLAKAHEIDVLEARASLGRKRKTWWIREGFSNNQNIYKGIIYVNGKCYYHPLLTDNDWITFFDKNASIPDLKALQREKVEKINTKRNNCIFFRSSSAYCQTVFDEECKDSLKSAYHMDVLEAQTALGSVNGTTWWIREGFSNNQNIYKGIVYVDGECYYDLLSTEDDWIAFFDKNPSNLDLKTLQKEKREKINMIQSNYMFFCSSSTYCRAVYAEECKGSFEKALQMDVLEAQNILRTVNKRTWWIREGFSNNQKIYKGIVYVNGTCYHHPLLTDNDWIAFFDENSSDLDLKKYDTKQSYAFHVF